jgi:hypothetical protein
VNEGAYIRYVTERATKANADKMKKIVHKRPVAQLVRAHPAAKADKEKGEVGRKSAKRLPKFPFIGL